MSTLAKSREGVISDTAENLLKLHSEKKSDISVMTPVLNVGAGSLSEMITKTGGAEIFTYVNDMLECIGPVVDKNKGRFVGLEDSGFTALFEGSCDDALKSAVSMCQYAANNTNRRFRFSELTVGISCGTVYSGSVGFGDYSLPLVISECTRTAAYLRNIAEKYNARILITESAADNIPNFFSEFNSRRLGKILYHKNGQSEFIYDVFDGDSIDVKNAKRRGKLFFETGVDKFIEGKYDVARSYFIELIKSYRNDSAAKEYLLLCDKCLNERASSERSYLEIW